MDEWIGMNDYGGGVFLKIVSRCVCPRAVTTTMTTARRCFNGEAFTLELRLKWNGGAVKRSFVLPRMPKR